MKKSEVFCSRTSAWRPGREIKGDFVPGEISAEMTSPDYKPQRTTGWIVNLTAGIPVRMTVVNPGSDSISKDLVRRWYVAADTIIRRIDGMCGPEPARPSSLDILLYLGDEKKRIHPGERVDPIHANTGMTTRDVTTGSARVLIYRREEALKTLTHELLHCYGFSEWVNHDAEVESSCHDAARAIGLRVPGKLKPAESMVDCFAIWLTCDLFDENAWPDCVDHARSLAANLSGCWNGDQTTAAFEYYCVKSMLFDVIDELFAAHTVSLQRPDKARIRAAFAQMDSGSWPERKQCKHLSMRMTPGSLSSVPPRA
jgi:hypothetical protein